MTDQPVCIMHLEDDPADAELVQAALESAGMTFRITQVQTRDEFGDALHGGGFDLILADFRLPKFDGVSALRMTQELDLDIPFIFVSGTMGEDAAIEGLTQGATDYVLKQKLSRLVPAVSRALREAENRRERKQAEQEREALIELLRLLNTSDDTHAMMRSTTALLSQISDCEAVGVRLREGEDFPYFETHGFPAEFVQMENQLCAVDEHGELVRDDAGHPVLECMCGNILCGRFDPSKPFFTAYGSFWTNSTSELLASATEADLQSPLRNRCNREGYESVALLPLRTGESTIGLLQFNDHRQGRFTPDKIAMLERFAGHLAIGLAHRRAEAELCESEERYRTVADFTYDWEYWIAPDGSLRYCSPACERVTGYPADEFVRDPGLLAAIVHPDDRAGALSHFDESLDHAAEPHELEYRIHTRSGEERWIAHVCQMVRHRDGANLGRRASNSDITERKRAEQKIEQQLHELQRWYQVTLTREGKVLEMKQEVNRLLHRLGEPSRYGEKDVDARKAETVAGEERPIAGGD